MYAYRGKRRTTYYTITAANQRINLGHDLIEAKRKLLDLEAGKPVAGSIAELIDRYMREVSPKKAPATHKDEQASAPRLKSVFGKMRPADIRPVHVAKYLDLRGETAPVRANREKAMLSHIYSMAMRWGIVDANPCRGVARNTETPRDRLVTDRELCGFIAHTAGSETGTLLALTAWLAYLTVQRRGDLLTLRLDRITDEGILIQQGKTGAKVLIEWTPKLRECVAEIRALPRPVRGLFLICNRAGQPYTDSGFKALWGRAMTAWVNEGGERFHFHDLRAKGITRMVEDGRKAQDLSGHDGDAMVQKVYDRRAFKRSKAVE
jgi:integrase